MNKILVVLSLMIFGVSAYADSDLRRARAEYSKLKRQESRLERRIDNLSRTERERFISRTSSRDDDTDGDGLNDDIELVIGSNACDSDSDDDGKDDLDDFEDDSDDDDDDNDDD